MKKVRIGIVGCGGIANGKHLPSIKANADLAEVVGFCDILRDRAEKAAKEYGSDDAKVYTDYHEMLKDKSVTDAVLPAYTYKPDLLFFSDITTDPSDWTNEAVRRYYDKTSVVLGDEAK